MSFGPKLAFKQFRHPAFHEAIVTVGLPFDLAGLVPVHLERTQEPIILTLINKILYINIGLC